MNPDLNLAFLQVLDSQSMNPDSDLESMISSDLDPESLLVSHLASLLISKLGLWVHGFPESKLIMDSESEISRDAKSEF